MQETYYIERVRKTDFSPGCNPRGKLYHKYRTKVTKYMKANLREKSADDDEDDEDDCGLIGDAG